MTASTPPDAAQTDLNDIKAQAARFQADFLRVKSEIGKVIVGNAPLVEGVLSCLIAGGHALLEGVPGVGKTLLVRTLAQAVNLKFARVQFTPDLMPADITGTNILVETAADSTVDNTEAGANISHTRHRQFQFQAGPLFANIVLADEINRATPKTQSALLEAMQEHQITVSGVQRVLEEPFLVLATQNPIEMEGTYPLPEAQLDRFMFKLLALQPTFEEMALILDRTTGDAAPQTVPVLDRATLLAMRDLARQVPVAPSVRDFAITLTLATQPDSPYAPPPVKRFVRYGSSPRGAQALITTAKIHALLAGRYHVALDDIAHVALPALRHRLILNFEGDAEGISTDALVQAALDKARA